MRNWKFKKLKLQNGQDEQDSQDGSGYLNFSGGPAAAAASGLGKKGGRSVNTTMLGTVFGCKTKLLAPKRRNYKDSALWNRSPLW